MAGIFRNNQGFAVIDYNNDCMRIYINDKCCNSARPVQLEQFCIRCIRRRGRNNKRTRRCKSRNGIWRTFNNVAVGDTYILFNAAHI